MMKVAGFTFLLVAVLVTLGAGQTPDSSKRQVWTPDSPPRPVVSTYHINARVVPESLLVRAEAEIEYVNRTQDTLRELVMIVLPNEPWHNGGRHLDSVLINGAPSAEAARYSDSAEVPLVLQSPLRPGESVALYTTFCARLDGSFPSTRREPGYLVAYYWLPVVRTSRWSDQPSGPCDYSANITVDSGWVVVAPGELLNDKELMGLPPNKDTIFADVIHNPLKAGGLVYGRLPSRNGRDTYVFLNRYSEHFDFCVLSGYLIDRAREGDITVETYYPEALSGLWKGYVARQMLDHVSRYRSLLGDPNEKSLKVIASFAPYAVNTPDVLSIPGEISDQKDLSAWLAWEGRRIWFSCSLIYGCDPWTSRLRDYCVLEVLDKAFGSDGMAMYRRHCVLGERSQGGNGEWPLQYMASDVRHLDCIRRLVGERTFWDAVKAVADCSTTGMECLASALSQSARSDSVQETSKKLNWLLSGLTETSWDAECWSLAISKISHAGDSSDLTGAVTSSTSCRAPVEIGYLFTGGDTVILNTQLDQWTGLDSVSRAAKPDVMSVCRFTHRVRGTPVAVILDPHHLLPDTDRLDNVVVLPGGNIRLAQREALHDPYRNPDRLWRRPKPKGPFRIICP